MVEFLLSRKGKFLNYALTFISCFFLVTTGWGQTETTAVTNPYAYSQAGLTNPTVTSDKDDYAPGEIAYITGTGWTLDSTVDIHLEEEPAHDHHHGYHGTVVDDEGNWEIRYPIEERHLGVKFTVVVDGVLSKYQGLAYFTDGDVRISSESPEISFTVDYQVYIGTTCSGTIVETPDSEKNGNPSSGTNIQITNSVRTLYNVNTLRSIKITASPTSEQGGTFLHWKDQNDNIIDNDNVLCIAGTTPTRFYTAIYSSCSAPVLTVSENLTESSDAGVCGATVEEAFTTTATGSPSPTVTYSVDGTAITSSYVFPAGTTTVTATASNGCGDSDIKTFTVTVADDVAPSAVAQDVTVLLSEGGTLTAAEFDNGSSDVCGAVTLAISQATFGCADLGANTVTLTVTDGSNNVSTTTATVTVVDDVAPSAVAQDVTVLLSEGGTLTAAEFDNGSSDVCGAVTLAISQATFGCADLGANTVTLTVTDGSNNVSTTTATVTVVDDVAPSAVAQDVTVLLSEGGTLTAAEFDNGSSDLCGAVTLAISQATFGCADLGANTVTLTVTDGSNNVSTTTATVTVVDDVAPSAVAQDVTVLLSEGGTLTAAEFDNGSSDLCGAVTLAISQATFGCADLGANTVTLTVTDGSNNVSTTTATVTVVDDVAPSAVAQDVTVLLSEGGTLTAAEFDNGSSDVCGAVTLAISQATFGCADLGANTVTLTVTDGSNNVSTTTATVTVVDDVAPSAVAQDVTVLLSEGGTLTAAEFDNGSSDLCGGAVTLAISQATFGCADLGANTVTLTVTDESNNVSTTTATVTVVDDVAPIITIEAKTSMVESDGEGNHEEFQVWLNNNGGAQATDNCIAIAWTNNFTALSDGCGQTGVAEVTFTAKDASGNVDTTIATFTIEDTSAPTLGNIVAIYPTAVNTNFTLTAPSSDLNGISKATWYFNLNGDASAIANQVVTPNSQTISGSSVSGTFNFGITQTGVYSVLLVVEDACGNKSEVVYEYVVVYDPSGGFVTGGGWITSPVVNGVEYMGVAGKANFGFNTKYKTGRNNLLEVDGNTNFQFKEGDFHFKSIAHENMSLVISGSHKATYRGIGTVNGSGSHYFIVTVIDGDASGGGGADKFRITVFPNGSTSPSGQPIYDNEYGVAANADASTTLGGGSIVIHKPKSSGTKMVEPTEKLGSQTVAQEPVTLNILGNLAVAPNPVRSAAAVRFSLIEDANITLTIFDFNGREVNRLFSGAVKAEEVKEVTFQRNNLMSGIYIVKLTTDRGHSYDKQIIIE